MAFPQSQSPASRASSAVMLLSLSALFSASARPLPSDFENPGQVDSSIVFSKGRLPSAGRSLLQIDVGTWVWSVDSDPAAVCTVLSDGVLEKWQPSAKFVQQLGSATKLILSKTDSFPEASGNRPQFFSAVHPEWRLVDSSNLPSGTPTRVFIGYNGNQLPVVFGPNLTLKSGSILGSIFWMFGVAPGTSEKDVASLAMIKLTTGAQSAFTSISVKSLPVGYQWYQATQPISS